MTGTGITSGSAAGDTSHLHALGVAPVTTAGTFDGAAVAVGDVEVKYTYYGDANLDGAISAADYLQIDNGFNSQGGPTPLTGWSNGDFNYDGKINGDDYTLIDNAFNTQGAPDIRWRLQLRPRKLQAFRLFRNRQRLDCLELPPPACSPDAGGEMDR